MPYTPPVYNAVVFNFTGTYTPPVYTAVVFNFGAAGPGTGDAIISFSDEPENDIYWTRVYDWFTTEDHLGYAGVPDDELQPFSQEPSLDGEFALDFANWQNLLFGSSEGFVDQPPAIPADVAIAQAEFGVWIGNPDGNAIARVELGAWLGDPEGLQISRADSNPWLVPPDGFTVSRLETGLWVIKHKRRWMGFVT